MHVSHLEHMDGKHLTVVAFVSLHELIEELRREEFYVLLLLIAQPHPES